VLHATFTRSEPWAPQQRDARHYPLWSLLKFHWAETALGLILVTGLGTGLVSLWLLPIALSLVLAVPLSAVSSVNIAAIAPKSLALNSPYTLREPAIFLRAKTARETFKAHLLANIAAQ
jgi:membrane glycosyltransferase